MHNSIFLWKINQKIVIKLKIITSYFPDFEHLKFNWIEIAWKNSLELSRRIVKIRTIFDETNSDVEKTRKSPLNVVDLASKLTVIVTKRPVIVRSDPRRGDNIKFKQSIRTQIRWFDPPVPFPRAFFFLIHSFHVSGLFPIFLFIYSSPSKPIIRK